MAIALIESEPTEASRTPRWPLAGAVVAAGILLVAGTLGARWYSGLSPLMPYSAGGASGPVAVGHTLYADTALYPQPTTDRDGNVTTPDAIPITISAITPRVEANTSNAGIRVLVCRRNGSNLGVGAQESGLSGSCADISPFASPTTINLGFMTAQVLVAVTPQQPGVVHIAGFDVVYSQGLRHATQWAGADLSFTAK
jgi:hypothetical protein